MIIRERVEVVCFDVGGTLIEVWPSVGYVYAEVARELGLPATSPAVLGARFGEAWRAKTQFTYSRQDWADLVVHTLGGSDAEYGVASRYFGRLYDRFIEASAWRLYDDVLPALEALRTAGVRLAVVSNWDHRLRPLLRNLQLDGFFEAIEASGESGFHKPSPRIFHRALARLGVAPAASLHVGDSYAEDVEGARAAGLRALWLVRGTVRSHAEQISSLLEVPMRLNRAVADPAANSEG